MYSITSNTEQLVLTSILIMLTVFMFSGSGFSLFPEDFYMPDIENGESTCSSMYHCFLTVLALVSSPTPISLN